MITDLVQIRRLGEQKRAENDAFRKHLKRHNFAEKRLLRLAEQVEDETDCTTCANCCRVATVRVNERDVERLAKFVGMKVPELIREYTEESPDEGTILRRGTGGCVFLAGSLCTVYESRPANCSQFPHLKKGEGSLLSRMWDFSDRATYCPITYNALEAWKAEVGFGGRVGRG